MHAMSTAVPVSTERPWWKTLLVATLLMLIPFLGWGMAATYVVYRGSPQNFRWAEALFNGIMLAVISVVISYFVWHQLGIRISAFGFLVA